MRERGRGMMAAALVTSVGCGLASPDGAADLTAPGVAAQLGAPTMDAGPPPADVGASDEAGDAGATAERVFPCDVAAILQDRCLLCHGDPPFRAPMPLVRPESFRGESWGDPQRSMIDVVSERVRAEEPGRKMPPPSLGEMPAAELKTLTDWLAAGAPPAPAGTVCPQRDVGGTNESDPGAHGDGSSQDGTRTDGLAPQEG